MVDLSSLPPSTRTDLEIDLLKGAVIDDRGDHLIVRSPRNPDFHWGNYVQVTTGDPDDAARWLRLFEAEFPAARHRAIGLPSEPDPAPWEGTGLRPDTVESLVTDRAPSPAALPAAYSVSPLTDDDWARLLAAELADNAESGEHPADDYERFMTAQFEGRRALVERGVSAWFGVHDADGLASSMGIVLLGEVARYQSVRTEPAHRRRGLARHLLTVTGEWALARGARSLVIVAEHGSDAGRLYARAGFSPGPLGHGRYVADLGAADARAADARAADARAH